MEPSVMPARPEVVFGSVKMFDQHKGFGFILGDDGSDYYFHASQGRGAETDLSFSVNRENRVPNKDDRVFFTPASPRQPGQSPQAMPWAFEVVRATLVPSVEATRIGSRPSSTHLDFFKFQCPSCQCKFTCPEKTLARGVQRFNCRCGARFEAMAPQ
jgi:cold shock CspA family protein